MCVCVYVCVCMYTECNVGFRLCWANRVCVLSSNLPPARRQIDRGLFRATIVTRGRNDGHPVVVIEPLRDLPLKSPVFYQPSF